MMNVNVMVLALEELRHSRGIEFRKIQHVSDERGRAWHATEQEALDHAISALRSTQDVERRIVEARIDEVGSLTEGGFYLAPVNDYERGWNASKVDSRRYADKRISELRASLERKGGE